MLKVEGGIDIIVCVKILTMPTFCSNHAHLCIHEAVGTGRLRFLGRRTSSKSTRAYFVGIFFLCDDSVRPMLC